MGALDIIAKVAPGFAANYAVKRIRYDASKDYKNAKRLYDAATANQYRKTVTGGNASPDSIVGHTGTTLRNLSRYLEENHDLTNAVFDDLLNNVIGAGCSKVPMVKNLDGTLATDINERLCELFDEWADSPDTTGELGFEHVERMVARHYWRDGEIFVRPIINHGRFTYKTRIPLALDMLDADFCPLDYQALESGVLHGVLTNQWGAPITYFFYKEHPNDLLNSNMIQRSQLKAVRAEGVYHLKMAKRLRQRRGIPAIHAVINRLQDIKDIEESERIAAKVASDFTFYIKKGGEAGAPTALNSDGNRAFNMQAGMGFELEPGEDVGSIQANRPNLDVTKFIEDLKRNVAGGTGTRFSSIARQYNGTYSAQRQELVEGAVSYRAQFTYFVRKFYRPVWNDFVTTVALSGLLGSASELANIDRSTLTRCEFRPPSLPWIDPQKEAKAWAELVSAKLESRQEIMRQRGRDPAKVIEEMQAEADNDLFGSMVEMADAAEINEQVNDDPETDDNDNESEAA